MVIESAHHTRISTGVEVHCVAAASEPPSLDCKLVKWPFRVSASIDGISVKALSAARGAHASLNKDSASYMSINCGIKH